jgi:tetratricopeptide (TPR) repeat protein
MPGSSSEAFRRRDRGRAAWICVGLVASVLLGYGQVVDHDFVDFDDNAYVSHNVHVARGLTWESVRWGFSTFHMGNWHPLTWLSHMSDCELFGLEPGPHHLVSVLLHAASAVVLFLALRRMTGSTSSRSSTGSVWPSAFVAALFALHPLHVESVAWVAERKDVLSGLFWMLTLWAYARYATRGGAGRYALVVAAFTLGLMAKPMLVTLPFVLLLLDVWPLGRWRPDAGATDRVPPRRLLMEKVPLFALAAVSSTIALVAQRSVAAVGSLEVLPLGARIQNAIVSYATYLWQTFWPSGLAYYYPHPAMSGGPVAPPAVAVAAAALVLVAVTIAVLASGRRRPYLAVGWLWYVGTLVPVIGLLQVGMQARADRYTYLPTVGLYIAVAWAATAWVERAPRLRRPVTAVAAVVLGACLVATWFQVGHWRDSRRLAEHALSVTHDNYQAHNLLGVALQQENDLAAAHASYRRALEIKPDFAEGLINLGTLLGELGRLDEAASLFRLALRVNPRQAGARAHTGLGAVLEKQGDFPGAVSHLKEALRLEPEFAEAYNNLGVVYEKQGDPQVSREAFETAIRLSPDYALAHMNLGGTLQRQGDLEGAVDHLRRAVRGQPDLLEARFKLAAVHAARGELRDAVAQFERVLETDPGFAEAHYNLGAVLAGMGEVDRAVAHLERALALDPDYELARRALETLR